MFFITLAVKVYQVVMGLLNVSHDIVHTIEFSIRILLIKYCDLN